MTPSPQSRRRRRPSSFDQRALLDAEKSVAATTKRPSSSSSSSSSSPKTKSRDKMDDDEESKNTTVFDASSKSSPGKEEDHFTTRTSKTTKKKKKKKKTTTTTTTTTTTNKRKVYRFSTLVPNTIPHAVMKSRKDWRELPLVQHKTSTTRRMEGEEDLEEEDLEGVATTTTTNIDFFYADVGWIHQNISYSRGGGKGGGGKMASSVLAGKVSARKVNHFANHSELTRKDLLAKNLQRASRMAKKNGNVREMEAFERVSPKTFALPGDLALFSREFDKPAAATGSAKIMANVGNKEKGTNDNDEDISKSNNVWIMKPIGQSQGRGIFFVWKRAQIRRWQNRRKKLNEELYTNNVNSVGFSTITDGSHQQQCHLSPLPSQYQQQSENCAAHSTATTSSHQNQHVFHHQQQQQQNNATINICKENYVAQKYIHNPFLIGGRKFDMRLYVLVLSFSPLVTYVYREGFARFSSKRYESKIKSNSTENYLVHLTNHSVQKKRDSYNASVCDLKWPLHKLRRHIRSTFDARVEEACFKEIECMIKLSCDAVKSSMIRDERCFELYGYDVMLDEHLKPWLIEVNASPSMTADSASDKELKTRVFEDVLNCVDFENKFATAKKEEEGASCSETSNSSSSKTKRSAASKTSTTSSHVSRLARLPLRVGGFDAIVNESKEKKNFDKMSRKPATIGTINTDRDENLKEIGVVSSPSSSDDDNDGEEDNEEEEEEE